MKTIFKGNTFSLVWNIIDRSTDQPFDFTGMKVEVALYSDSCRIPLHSYNVNQGTISAEIPANTLPAGVYNVICRYITEEDHAYCVHRNAFQISNRAEFGSETVEIESVASHVDAGIEDPDYEKCQLIAEEVFRDHFKLPELTAERAVGDEHGNRITDTYVTRNGLTEHIKQTYNQQFTENPPLITEGYITPEMLSDETRQMLEATGQQITNLPDGEDLTTIHGVLKFANKEHNEKNYTGMGRFYLRKNIVAGVNILTQSMFPWKNTIYIIQYDYDLQGAEITIPEGCVLDFQGGCFVNGILKGNILNEHIKPEWFGAKGDNITDDTESFINTFRLASNGTKILLRNTIYSVGRLTFKNCGNLYVEGENGATLKLNTDRANIIQIEDGQTVVIDNVIFDGNDFKMISNGGGLVQLNGGITKTVIKNCVFQNFKSSASSNGFATSANKNFTVIENCKFIRCATGPYLSDCTVVSCEFIECDWGCQFSTSSHFVVSNCKFLNNKGDIYLKTDYETDIDKGIISNNFFIGTGVNNSIIIATTKPKTTRDNNIIISNNVFDLEDNSKVLTLGQINTDNSFYLCNGVIFQDNIVKNCGGLATIYNANNVRLYNNVVTGGFLNIQGPIKDFVVDGLIVDFKGKENVNFIHLQGHYQTNEWLVDFTIRNFKAINAGSFNCVIYQYYENNNDNISDNSIINIENDKTSFSASIKYYTNDKLYNKVYFKYISSNIERYGVKRAFGIGKIIIVGSLLYYWNGETFVKLDTPEMDNVFIVYYRNTNPSPMMVKPNRWKELQNSGEVALGVAVINGDKLLVVSLDEILLKWSSANVNGDGVKATSINAAIKDWNGKDNTHKQILHEECSGIEYAPGYCANYSKTNSNGSGIKAGKWWLPAMGELLMLFANRDKINYALSFIDGATLLDNYYWASTENNDIYSWYMSFPDGYINSDPYAKKAESNRYVRPVTEFPL